MLNYSQILIYRPKEGFFSDFLHDYMDAVHIGQSQNPSCDKAFPLCPVSLFNLFQIYSTPEEKQIRPPVKSNIKNKLNEDSLGHSAKDSYFYTESMQHPTVGENLV